MKRFSEFVFAATLACATPVLADGRCDHDHGWHARERCGPTCVIRVAPEPPSWAMVFTVETDGRFVTETHGRAGVLVASGRSDADLCSQLGRGLDAHGGAWRVLVRSRVPFSMQREYRRDQVFHINRRGQLSREETRRVCRLLGVRPQDVQISVYPIRAHETRVCRYCQSGISAQLWAGIAGGGGVYVDGGFCGQGLEVLARLGPGRHRLTVIVQGGRKYSEWVEFPAGLYACESEGAEFCRVHP